MTLNKEVSRESIQLHLLVSLARSQRALARLLESAADLAEAETRERLFTAAAEYRFPGGEDRVPGTELRDDIAAQLRAIERHQRVLTAKIAGVLPWPAKTRSGKPALPWLCAGVVKGK